VKNYNQLMEQETLLFIHFIKKVFFMLMLIIFSFLKNIMFL